MFDVLPKIVAELRQYSGLDDLKKMQHGVEKESLRIDEMGQLSQLPHPHGLGSAFTHDEITTDFSESLLEFITAPSQDLNKPLDTLTQLHQFTVRQLERERLWPCSMPCVLTPDTEIPLANYGHSNMAKMKTLYRKGLGLRYGRAMQVIAGVHYNFSFDEAFIKNIWARLGRPVSADPVSDAYFAMIRNYRRVSWLVPYLFGASPTVCGSFFKHEANRFPMQDNAQYANPYAVSLRLSDIGYKNRTHDKIAISYDSLEAYVSSLKKALLTPDPTFETIGLKKGEEWLQLNTNIVQIEAEYYGSIRPKRIPHALERTVHALATRGVQYVEIRTLDLYPFSPIGVDERSLRFLDCLMLACFLIESPVLSTQEKQEQEENLKRVVNEGRKPGLTLRAHGSEMPLEALGLLYLKQFEVCADLLNDVFKTNVFGLAIKEAKQRFLDRRKLPSQQLLDKMQENENSFFKTGLILAQQHFEILQAMPLSIEAQDKMRVRAAESWRRQQAIEALPEVPFESFLKQYFDTNRL